MPRKRNSLEARLRRRRQAKGGEVQQHNPTGERVDFARTKRPEPVVVPHPLIAPLGITLRADDVQEVWDTFVKPHQDEGPQSVELRMLMAILRSTYTGLSEVEQGRVFGADR